MPFAAAPSPASAAPASATAAAVPGAGPFQIAVAAFRTESRAAGVVSALKDLQVPATVRADSTGTWQRVVAGPFATRDAAQAAQETLTRAGYADTRIAPLP